MMTAERPAPDSRTADPRPAAPARVQPPRGAGARLPLGRWAGLLALLLAEGLTLGLRFDSAGLASLPPGWWTVALRPAGAVMPVGAALLAALLLVCGRGLRRGLGDPLLTEALRRHGARPYAAAQLLGFAALFLLSQRLFEGLSGAGADGPRASSTASAGSVGLTAAAWLLAAALTFASWLGALVPPRLLAALARRHAAVLAGATVLGLLAFAAGRLAQDLWLPLRGATFLLASGLLGLFGPVAFVDAATFSFGTDRFIVEIAPACSGYEGVGLAGVFLLAALWLFRGDLRFPRALWLVPLVTAGAYLANAARLTALVLVGTHLSPDLAAGGFHSYAGSLFFCAVALASIALALRSRWFGKPAAHGADEREGAREGEGPAGNAAAPYLVPFLAMVAAGLLSRCFSTPAEEPLYALRPLAGLVALLAYRRAWGGGAGAWAATEAPRCATPAAPPLVLRVFRCGYGFGFAAAAGLGVAATWLALELVLPAAPSSLAAASAGIATPAPAALALRLGAALLLAPIAEELAFRGCLARFVDAWAARRRLLPGGAPRAEPVFDARLATELGLPAVLLSSLAFGLLHQRIVAGVVAGVAYALVYRRRGRLADAVVAHAATNAALVLAAAVSGRWDLWL